MPDTIRTLAQLNQMFAGTGDVPVSPQDIRDLFASLMVHGEIGSGAKSAITLATGYQPLDFTVAGNVSRGLTVDTANRWISGVPVNMKAEVTLEVLFQGATNTTFDFAVFRNPDTTPVQEQRVSGSIRIFNAAMIGSLCISAALDLNAGDKLQAAVRGGAVSFTLLRGALRVRRIAVE